MVLLMLRTSAEGDMVSKSTTNIKLDNVVLIETLKPITPNEAIFEDIDSINIYNLRPVTPSEATFEE